MECVSIDNFTSFTSSTSLFLQPFSTTFIFTQFNIQLYPFLPIFGPGDLDLHWRGDVTLTNLTFGLKERKSHYRYGSSVDFMRIRLLRLILLMVLLILLLMEHEDFKSTELSTLLAPLFASSASSRREKEERKRYICLSLGRSDLFGGLRWPIGWNVVLGIGMKISSASSILSWGILFRKFEMLSESYAMGASGPLAMGTNL